VLNVVEIRDGWKLYIVTGGVMVRILLNERAQRKKIRKYTICHRTAAVILLVLSDVLLFIYRIYGNDDRRLETAGMSS
jgi:cytochrome b subunit of formate dehydrogenase